MCLLAPAATMAAAELQEGADDVLWPGRHHHHHSPDDGRDDQRQQPHCWSGRKQPCPRPRVDDDAARGGSKVRRRPGSSAAASAPVAIIIPVAAVTSSERRRRPSSSWAEDDYYGDGDGDDEAAFVPPHVALEARWRLSEGRAASSMCEGLGRTLKGRDLQSVRTAVLRITGFIET